MEPISPYKPPSSGIRIGGTEISFKQVIVALLLSFCVAHSGYALYGDYTHSEGLCEEYKMTKEQVDYQLGTERVKANALKTNAEAEKIEAETKQKLVENGYKVTVENKFIPDEIMSVITQTIKANADKMTIGDATELVKAFQFESTK